MEQSIVRGLRVQRKRTKGFKMPENTVYVGRGTKWGNPFKLDGDMIFLNASHRRKILSPWVFLCFGNKIACVELYRAILENDFDRIALINEILVEWNGTQWSDFNFRNEGNIKNWMPAPEERQKYNELLRNTDIHYWVNYFKTMNLQEIKGKKLACWCDLRNPCHADVLIELANK